MAADHINYEEDFNMRYKTHPIIVNLSMRVCMYWFVMSCLMISVSLGDMTKLFTTHEYWYPAQPPEDPEQIARYETLYMFDRPPVF